MGAGHNHPGLLRGEAQERKEERKMDDTKKYREIAVIFRGIADAADEVANVNEKENSTPEEMEEALKNFLWETLKMQAISQT